MVIQKIDAYKIEYRVNHGQIGNFPYPDKFWDTKGIAVYIPNADISKALLVKSAEKEPGMISGPLALMYQTTVGKEAEDNWDKLLSTLKFTRKSEKIKKIRVGKPVVDWAKSLYNADHPSKEVSDLLGD